jgi:hypothetical protein
MKLRIAFVLAVVCMLSFAAATAQVTNLQINLSTTSFTMVSGDVIQWEYDLPVGDTAYCEIWNDVNQNGAIDPGTDVIYLDFFQIDGGSADGPPDTDGLKNGHIAFSGNVGLAPGHFVMRVTDHGAGQAVPGVITPLPSPAHLISGTVTVPSGKSAAYIVIEASPDQEGGNFWQGITDASGNYTIAMDADTAGNPWRIQISRNPYPPAIIAPERSLLTITGNHSGLDFTITAAAAQVAGYVWDATHKPVPSMGVNLWQVNGMINRYGRTDAAGFYQIGVTASELGSLEWRVQTSIQGSVTTTQLVGQRWFGQLSLGDSVFKELTVYDVNAQITGQVRVNGGAPGGPITMVALNQDTAQAVVNADPSTGNFVIGVSNLIWNYSLFPTGLPPNYMRAQVTAHPGDTGVVINITATSVDEQGGELPRHFVLDQNYPNPFNPATTIRYGVPQKTMVTLAVFNLLGQQVATLVAGEQEAGYHDVRFDGSRLASGMYFYRLEAGSFVQTRSLLLVK